MSVAVLRCPELQRPNNGYFVNDYCDSVFNAACGIKCKPGYDLRGNSLRICQENGQWSGETAECVSKHKAQFSACCKKGQSTVSCIMSVRTKHSFLHDVS